MPQPEVFVLIGIDKVGYMLVVENMGRDKAELLAMPSKFPHQAFSLETKHKTIAEIEGWLMGHGLSEKDAAELRVKLFESLHAMMQEHLKNRT